MHMQRKARTLLTYPARHYIRSHRQYERISFDIRLLPEREIHSGFNIPIAHSHDRLIQLRARAFLSVFRDNLPGVHCVYVTILAGSAITCEK